MLEIQTKWVKALEIYLQALAIDLKYCNEDWIDLNIKALGRILKVMGEHQFKVVWQKVTGARCSEELSSAIQAASENQEE